MTDEPIWSTNNLFLRLRALFIYTLLIILFTNLSITRNSKTFQSHIILNIRETFPNVHFNISLTTDFKTNFHNDSGWHVDATKDYEFDLSISKTWNFKIKVFNQLTIYLK